MAESMKIADGSEQRRAGPGLRKTVAIVGLMGSGKSAIGRRLASWLDVPFADSDALVEAAVGMPVSQIFETRGEVAFREMERDAVAKALQDRPLILATGGGAFLCPKTRVRLQQSAVTLWLRACVDILAERCSRNHDRPLLHGRDIRSTLERLVAERYPVYAEADMVLDCAERPHEETVALALQLLAERSITGANSA